MNRGPALAPKAVPTQYSPPEPAPQAAHPTPAQEPEPQPYQPALFSTREIGRVVPISGPLPARKRTATAIKKAPSVVPAVHHQEPLPFQNTVRARSAAADASRFCNAPVAVPMHRFMAAVADYSLVSIAMGAIVGMLHVAAGSLLVNVANLPTLAVVFFVLSVSYKLLWAFADTDSPGLRWAHLRTVNFDGKVPARAQRLQRVAAGCLSLLAGGIGIIWILADEETLSWHDHMSKTFLTSQLESEDPGVRNVPMPPERPQARYRAR